MWIGSLRYEWSAIRHHSSVKKLDLELYAKYIPAAGDLAAIKSLSELFMLRYEFTRDDLSELFDSMDTPASCFKQIIDSPPLRDDCDGYHAALLYAVGINNETQLLTYVTKSYIKSHTLLVMKLDSEYYYVDNNQFGGPFAALPELVNDRAKGQRLWAVEFSHWNGRKWQRGWRWRETVTPVWIEYATPFLEF